MDDQKKLVQRQSIIDAVNAQGGRIEGMDLREIQVKLGFSEISRTDFKKHIGALATDGSLGWKRPTYGSNHIIDTSVSGIYQ
jgi:hypothetical protein